ncbi:condensation domain-containing protein [Microbispora sp. H10670]|uniref:condensation domain-containing protein n=1 Tax=Microbispora sp. H10670 TaxID=2729108 RepID=UPI001603FB00|nr:condensation domain-containing protein [Microbispora sp. H10670]
MSFPLGRASVYEVDVVPASLTQERQWFLQKFEGNVSSVYNFQTGLRFRGRFSVRALADALTELVNRHEILRTTFGHESGTLVQYIHPRPPAVPLHHVELDDVSDDALRCWIRGMLQRPFDQENGPLFSAHLVPLADDDHVLVLFFDHLVCDAWSLRVLHNELTTLYLAAEEQGSGERSRLAGVLPELPIQYGDYAAWQRESMSGETGERQLDFWRRRLTHPPRSLDLSPASRRPARRTGNTFIGSLHHSTVAELEALTRRHGASLFTGLLTVYAILLHRYSGQEDFVTGTLVDNRTRQEFEPLVGLFTNTVALRFDASGAPTFREMLRRVREVWFDAHEHQEVPYDWVVKELRPARGLGRQPFFDVMMQYADVDREVVRRGELQMEAIESDFGPAPVDLILGVVKNGGWLTACWDYAPELFDADGIRRMHDHYTRLLASSVTTPDRGIGELEMLTEPEQSLILRRWCPDADGLDDVLGCPGLELGGSRALILDSRNHLVPAGVPGRLFVAGSLRPNACPDTFEVVDDPGIRALFSLIDGETVYSTQRYCRWSAEGRICSLTDSGHPESRAASQALPGGGSGPGGAPGVASGAMSELEWAIGDIWREVLNRDVVEPDDDFFDLGGHSLAATQVINRLDRDFDIEVPISLVFEYSELGSFVRALVELERAKSRPGGHR